MLSRMIKVKLVLDSMSEKLLESLELKTQKMGGRGRKTEIIYVVCQWVTQRGP